MLQAKTYRSRLELHSSLFHPVPDHAEHGTIRGRRSWYGHKIPYRTFLKHGDQCVVDAKKSHKSRTEVNQSNQLRSCQEYPNIAGWIETRYF